MSEDRKVSSASESDNAGNIPEPSEAEVASTVAEITRQTESAVANSVVNHQATASVRGLRKRPGAGVLIGGILLPVITLGIELSTRMCANLFFDPMPTWWHTALVVLVPAGNLFLWLKLRKDFLDAENDRQLLGWLNGIVMGIAFFYTLAYLPLTPLAIFAVVIYGLGLLPLTPLIALITSFVTWAHWRNAAAEIGAKQIFRNRPIWLGTGASLLLLLLMDFPRTITTLGMKMANSENASVSHRGLQLLRMAGSKNEMVRACYDDRRESLSDLGSWLINQGDPVSADEARKIYYRVTGKSFSSIVRPQQRSRRDLFRDSDIEWDTDQAGATVAGRLKGLSLGSSRLDQSIDAKAATSYTEWTLTFKNVATVQREARAQIALPPGGVVSRLTLWINGEEREAAFAGRGKVTQVYQQIVQQRRDPVLVTTQGPDRVMMQCFPVPANGGEMKVRLGITAPLTLPSRQQALAFLPYFIERNFGITSETNHYVWSESAQPLMAGNDAFSQSLKAEKPAADRYALRGGVSELVMATGGGIIRLDRNSEMTEATATDVVDKKIIQQKIEEAALQNASRIVLVIDGSQPMQTQREALQHLFRWLPASAEYRVLIAGDEISELTGNPANARSGAQNFSDVSKLPERLQSVSFAGGADNIAALEKAWDLAAEKSDGVIVWVHSAQPVLLGDVELLRQRWQRNPGSPVLYDYQVDSGVNRVMEKLEDIAALHTVTRQSGTEKDLKSLLLNLTGGARPLILKREKTSNTTKVSPAEKSNSHLARLWAKDEVMRLITASATNTEAAQKLAATYQLVTPVSGAVVLETQQQYKSAGLNPVDANTVPTIPEPETWLLMAIVGAVLLWTIYHWRRKCI